MKKINDDTLIFDTVQQRAEELKILHKTSAEKKMTNYALKLFNDNLVFKKEVSKIRHEHNIPKTGLTKNFITTIGKRSRKEITTEEPYTERVKDIKSFEQKISKLADEHNLPSPDWRHILIDFVIYNQVSISASNSSRLFSMTKVVDVNYFLNGYGDSKDDKDSGELAIRQLARYCPVALFLNPYLSERDILDSVRNLYKVSIEPALKKYKKEEAKNGKVRTKNERVERRNNFIYKNRLLSKIELIKLVRKEFDERLDQSYLNKIIREEKAKRK
jgi:hypothetical protein